MDFNNEIICDLNLGIDALVIDYSTWRYLEPLKVVRGHSVLKYWVGMIVPHASMVFESGLSSFKIVSKINSEFQSIGNWFFEFNNPSHPIFTLDQIKNFFNHQIDYNLNSIINTRVIVNANTNTDYLKDGGNPTNKTQEFGSKLREITRESLNLIYQEMMRGYGMEFTDMLQEFPIQDPTVIPKFISFKKSKF